MIILVTLYSLIEKGLAHINVHTSWMALSTKNIPPQLKEANTLLYHMRMIQKHETIGNNTKSNEYMICDYRNVQLLEMECCSIRLDLGWHQDTERGRRSELC